MNKIKIIKDPKEMQKRIDIAQLLQTYMTKMNMEAYLSFIPKKSEKEGYFYFVLENNKSEPLCFAGLRVQYGLEESSKFLDLQYLVTDPKYKFKGYGTKLIREICEYANKNGFVSFNSTLSDDSAARNLGKFYSSMGFLLSGLRISKNLKYPLKIDQETSEKNATNEKQIQLLQSKKYSIESAITILSENKK